MGKAVGVFVGGRESDVVAVVVGGLDLGLGFGFGPECDPDFGQGFLLGPSEKAPPEMAAWGRRGC